MTHGFLGFSGESEIFWSAFFGAGFGSVGAFADGVCGDEVEQVARNPQTQATRTISEFKAGGDANLEGER